MVPSNFFVPKENENISDYRAKAAWSTQQVPGEPDTLNRKTPSQKGRGDIVEGRCLSMVLKRRVEQGQLGKLGLC